MPSLEIFLPTSSSPQGGSIMEKRKPTLNEVVEFVQSAAKKSAGKCYRGKPTEHQKEMVQEAALWAIENYEKIIQFLENKVATEGFEIDGLKGIKSYLRQRSNGEVIDYIKAGNGFEDFTGWNRISLASDEGEEIELDQVLGNRGVFGNLDPHKVNIKWDLVSKLASEDSEFHAFAMQLLGIQLRLIAPVLNVEIARADQLVKAFIERFDSWEHYNCDWLRQCAYALGISELLGWPNEPVTRNDGGMVGQDLIPVDLYSTEPNANYKLKNAQEKFDKVALGSLKMPEHLKKAKAVKNEFFFDEKAQLNFDVDNNG